MPYQRIKFYQTGSFAAGNRLLPEDLRSIQASNARSNTLTCGHRACQGCGEALGARYALDAVMRATKGGDGGTVDVGMACLSGMFERNDDVLYICYDNQAYMNTGVQRSGATPPAARTATTPAVGPEPGNAFGQGKNAPLVVQQWLYHAEEGDPDAYEAAWRQIMADNPFPAIMGRVCYRPCETACNRGQLDEAVGINSVERFLGDEAILREWQTPVAAAPTGKRVLVVGAGPSGLSCAYHLTRLGHSVTVRDAGAQLGGMMRYGIPKYRLPRDVLDAEISRVVDMGVTLELNSTVTDLLTELTEGGGRFDAAFVAVGAHIGKRAYIPAGDSARIMDAVSLARSPWFRSSPDRAVGPRARYE
jgi:hypothetical protein